ncbi:hypothetical protein RFI_12227 [Reticulomyxa filosa]|uniref:Uncharacterized protein n=1 Tax=Reticulomyxa filosa TaxID=46433 RepID=X6NGB6_RETFI|nr:hypothetical protein RFI_12227 [Reticulomyxa filosa]|eukprot:ETO24928.1 hypothetical protein RFI_12227 [Reticulomyxa filosa]
MDVYEGHLDVGWKVGPETAAKNRIRLPNPKKYSNEVAHALGEIWELEQVKNLWKERYSTLPGYSPYIGYYLDSIQQIGREDYMPEEADLIRSPLDNPNTIEECNFFILSNAYKFVDVNANDVAAVFKDLLHQKNPSALLFVVSLGSYCEEVAINEPEPIAKSHSRQDSTYDPNVMRRSINLFYQILTMCIHEKPKCILLLTEKRLLKERIVDQNIPFDQYFGKRRWGNPDLKCKPFAGKKTDDKKPLTNDKYIDRIVRFIIAQFENEINHYGFPKLSVIVEDNDCTDPGQIKKICLQINQALNL